MVAGGDDVLGVFHDLVPFDLLPDDTLGRIATEAWNSRCEQRAGPARVGDGAMWDDPRFESEGRPAADDE
jgi:hypothetical protein